MLERSVVMQVYMNEFPQEIARDDWQLSERKKVKHKDVEIRIVAELMKNSHRSDREIAHAIGTSQPTVSRTIKKLEAEGVIKEYTMIPDFKQLGYQIMGVTLMGLQSPLSEEQFEEFRKATSKIEESVPHPALMGVNGMGSDKNRLFISFYDDYSDYFREARFVRELPYINIDRIETFLVDLHEETVGVGVLSLSNIADSLLRRLNNKERAKSAPSGVRPQTGSSLKSS